MWRISMLHRLLKIGPMPADARGARLAKLLEQEQLWFSWLTVLHERLGKVKPGAAEGMQTEGQKVLEIAKRRWLEAKEALRQHHAGD